MLQLSTQPIPGTPRPQGVEDLVKRLHHMPKKERLGQVIGYLEQLSADDPQFEEHARRLLGALQPRKPPYNPAGEYVTDLVLERFSTKNTIFLGPNIPYNAGDKHREIDIFAVERRNGKLHYSFCEIKTAQGYRKKARQQMSAWLQFMRENARVPESRLDAVYVGPKGGAYYIYSQEELFH